MNDNLHQLRCFGCGERISGSEARPDFHCANCGNLFEVEYPGWNQRKGPERPNPGALKWLWRERRCSAESTMISSTSVPLETAEEAKKVLRVMDALEEHDDVQDVYANFDIPDAVLDSVEA